MAADHRKLSIYLPTRMANEIRAEAERTDRSVSWLLQQAWQAARYDLAELPSVESNYDDKED